MIKPLELTDEERDAFDKAFAWMDWSEEHDEELEEGYKEAWILANLLKKWSEVIVRDRDALLKS